MAQRTSKKPVSVAAIDLGATSGRVIVGTYRQGQPLALQEVHRFPNQFHQISGHSYWNLGGLFAEILTGLKAARTAFPELASCGVDTWGVDYVLLDAKGRLVYPAHAYRDVRTDGLFRKLARTGIKQVYDWTGLPNLSYNSSLQLQETLQSHPGIRGLAKRCLFLPDYFNFLLSGKMRNEVSIASTSQLLDVAKLSFSMEALDFFGIPREWFRGPVKAGIPLGVIQGLDTLEGIKVTLVPGHDTSCAYDAMPASENGTDIYLSSGTWSLVGFESETPVTGPEALKEIVSNERMGDGRFRPIKNCLGLWLLEQTLVDFRARMETSADWEELISEAESRPAPEIRLDPTDRSLFAPASMRHAIDAQLRKNGGSPPDDLAGYTRLICESLGEGHAKAVSAFTRMTGRSFERILMVGGGSKNRLLCQATANSAGIPVVSFTLEGTAVGNLANQFIALGVVPDLATFRKQLGRHLSQRTYTPAV